MAKLSPLLLGLFIASATGAGEPPTGPVRIASIDWCPFVCPRDETRNGLLVDYTRSIFAKAGNTVEINYYPWSRAILLVERGEADALLAPAKNEAPGLIYPQTPIGHQRFCFYGNASDDWHYTGPASIGGRRVIYPQDALPEELAMYRDSPTFAKLPYSESYLRETIRRILTGQYDNALMTYYATLDFLNRNGYKEQIGFKGCVNRQALYLAFTPQTEQQARIHALIEAFETHIERLDEANYFDSLVTQYGLADE